MGTYFLPNQTFSTPPEWMFFECDLRLLDGTDVVPLILEDEPLNLTYEFGDRSFLALFDTVSADGTVQKWQIQGDVELGQDYTFGEVILWPLAPDLTPGGEAVLSTPAAFNVLIGLQKTGENVDIDLPLFTMNFRSVVPEPTTLILLSACGVALLARRLARARWPPRPWCLIPPCGRSTNDSAQTIRPSRRRSKTC